MGTFSWHKVDSSLSLEEGTPFKLLIPKELALKANVPAYIKDPGYLGYGYVGRGDSNEPLYDIYELLAIWNDPDECDYEGEYTPLKRIDKYTNENRSVGISIACGDIEMAGLRYPLRLVEEDCQLTYEDFEGIVSINDIDQGWSTHTLVPGTNTVAYLNTKGLLDYTLEILEHLRSGGYNYSDDFDYIEAHVDYIQMLSKELNKELDELYAQYGYDDLGF